jgi:glycosyltransferase involved in cell wall biosynthesis
VLHVMRMTGVSGSENHLLYLTQALPSYGWRSSVLIPTPQPARVAPLVKHLSESCDRVHVVRMRRDVAPSVLRTLTHLLRGEHFDLAHAHLVHADWYLAAASIFGRGVPLVSTKHNPDPFRRLASFRVVERTAMRRYKAVIAISESLKKFTEDIAGSRRVAVVEYGIPMRRRAPAERRPQRIGRVLAVGRLTRQKGFDVAIRAFASVTTEISTARLEIAGEGEERAFLSRLIAELGLARSVTLLGERDDILELMQQADALVHPARWEGFGLVLLEAMSAGLPIVASRVGAIPEVVDDEITGVLVPPDDPSALAAALLRLLREPELRGDFVAAGFSRLMSRFSVERMAARTAAVYDSVLESSTPHP